MKVKSNIKRALRLTGYLLLTVALVILLAMISVRERKVPCHAVQVHIPDSLQLGFVTANEVKSMVMKSQGAFLGKPIKDIHTEKIEKDLERHPYIRTAEAYKDVKGILHVEVFQRRPVVKVYLRGGKILFLDDTGHLLPFSRHYPVHLLTASGKIPLPSGRKYSTVEDLPEGNPLQDIYHMALFIDKHPFWKAQIEQIYVDGSGEYSLTPRVGAHAILLGDASAFEEKMKKLKILYTHALNNLGWNNYTQINLKFKNQIVCTRR